VPDLIPFQFHTTIVSAITDENGDPWFVAADVCEALGDHEGLHTELSQQWLSLMDMLAVASSIDNYHMAIDFLQWVSKCAVTLNAYSKSFGELRQAVMVSHVAWKIQERQSSSIDEFYWHKVFRKHLADLIPGATIVPRKKNEGERSGYPDFLVKVNNKVCPVEIKRNMFDEKAVNQLMRYIIGFRAIHGYAVAQTCIGKLKRNMTFLSLAGLEV
jgi:hypothetical protein